jgi:tripartite-type tricarboxylate transporter receptor subunit TctC
VRLLRASAVLCAIAAAAAHAQTYPAKPLRMIVPLAPGGAVDTVARTLAQGLGEGLRQTVIVDNRAGGATNIGT